MRGVGLTTHHRSVGVPLIFVDKPSLVSSRIVRNGVSPIAPPLRSVCDGDDDDAEADETGYPRHDVTLIKGAFLRVNRNKARRR